MADPEHFDVDPDLFKLMRIRIQIFLAKERKKILTNLHFFLHQNLTQLVMCNFLTNNEGGGLKREG